MARGIPSLDQGEPFVWVPRQFAYDLHPTGRTVVDTQDCMAIVVLVASVSHIISGRSFGVTDLDTETTIFTILRTR